MSAPESQRRAKFRISTDWAAVIVAGVFVLAAVFGVLPKIPW
ncbi:hypothetical protein [Solihabitans fulvus]|nr:hypothetical protein [Solihabitans fulvus]